MREISAKIITKEVANACVYANTNLPLDVKEKIENAQETDKLAKKVFAIINENLEYAKEKQIPICQDTGMVIAFVKLGQDVKIVDGFLYDAINEGVRQGYVDGFLRLSVVEDPLTRINTNDNTPAVIYTEVVKGDTLEIVIAPKGFGSENMSALKMFTPSATKDDIVNFVADTCINAGSNPCPPIFVGVGIGGTADKALVLSKEALILEQKDTKYKELEEEILTQINKSGVGPQGIGGKNTALSVKINTFPTHIAGLPVGVSIGCHVTRHKKIVF